MEGKRGIYRRWKRGPTQGNSPSTFAPKEKGGISNLGVRALVGHICTKRLHPKAIRLTSKTTLQGLRLTEKGSKYTTTKLDT